MTRRKKRETGTKIMRQAVLPKTTILFGQNPHIPTLTSSQSAIYNTGIRFKTESNLCFSLNPKLTKKTFFTIALLKNGIHPNTKKQKKKP